MSQDEFYNPNGGIVDSIHALSQKIIEFTGGKKLPRVYLRGQCNVEWGLVPTIGRSYSYIGRTIAKFDREREYNLLHRFRRRAYAHYNRVIGDWEGLFLARHHGLPVRLLDWTMNPLVALYNACTFEKNPESNAAVWAFVPDQKQEHYINVLEEQRSPLKIPGVKVLYPYDISPRLTVQSSVFTIQEDPQKELQEYNPQEFSEENFDIGKLIRWSIPKESKESIIEALDRTAINARTLFPDLDGLAKGIWQSEVTRYGKVV